MKLHIFLPNFKDKLSDFVKDYELNLTTHTCNSTVSYRTASRVQNSSPWNIQEWVAENEKMELSNTGAITAALTTVCVFFGSRGFDLHGRLYF